MFTTFIGLQPTFRDFSTDLILIYLTISQNVVPEAEG